MSLAQRFWDAIKGGGKRPFLITPHQTYTYADLAETVRRWLALFDRNGLTVGDRVVIQTQLEFAAITCFVASLIDGKVPVTLSADTAEHRTAAILDTAEAALFAADRSVLENPALVATCPKHIISESGEGERARAKGIGSIFRRSRSAALAGIPAAGDVRDPHLDIGADALAYLLFTSGSTDAPTGVKITHANLSANLETLSRLFEYDENSRIFNDMIIAHADGMVQGPLLALANRCACIRAGGFELSRLEDWLLDVRRHRATHVITVPTVWAMIDAYAEHSDFFDAPECRSLQSVAAKLADDLWERLEQRFGKTITSHYGLTETVASALYAGGGDGFGARGSLGIPIDCEARIDPAAIDGEGELQLRGANVFAGYWRNPERNSQSMTDDGWLRTGDLAEIADDGNFQILGRLKNVIMSGGFLIRPDEIDEAMLWHPSVTESATVTLDDPMFGEIPGTIVVTDGDVSVTKLTEHARKSLEARKVPRRIVVADRIERGPAGKPLLGSVRAALEAEAEQSGTAAAAGSGSDHDEAVLALAADIFRIPQDQVALENGPDDVGGWDSFSQLTLIMEAEKTFSIAIPASRVASISTLADLRNVVRELAE